MAVLVIKTTLKRFEKKFVENDWLGLLNIEKRILPLHPQKIIAPEECQSGLMERS